MVKNILKEILKIILLVLTYLIQIYVINETELFGISGNLCLMYIVFIAMLSKTSTAFVYAVVCGLLSDMLFSNIIGKYVIIYVITVALLIGLKKMYKQDTKWSVIVFGLGGTIIFEIMMFIFNLLQKLELVNIFSVILLVFKESILNVFFLFIIYLLLKKLYVTENE